jgi:hypothetical protein
VQSAIASAFDGFRPTIFRVGHRVSTVHQAPFGRQESAGQGRSAGSLSMREIPARTYSSPRRDKCRPHAGK